MAQGFTTGQIPTATSLSNIQLNFALVPSQYERELMKMQVHTSVGGTPGTAIYTMISPPGLVFAHQTFGVPDGARLEPNTAYFMVVHYPPVGANVGVTASNADQNLGSGWTLANERTNILSLIRHGSP